MLQEFFLQSKAMSTNDIKEFSTVEEDKRKAEKE
jgi:hypothetical protein